jgi:hypothetical protein
MAIKPPLPENISHASLNDARRELDDKLNNIRIELDSKIEKKVSITIFCWVMGIFVIVLMGICAFYGQLESTKSNKIESLQDRTTVLETKNNYRSIRSVPSTPATPSNPSK